MVSSAAKMIDAYLDELPGVRREVIVTVRDLNRRPPSGYAKP